MPQVHRCTACPICQGPNITKPKHNEAPSRTFNLLPLCRRAALDGTVVGCGLRPCWLGPAAGSTWRSDGRARQCRLVHLGAANGHTDVVQALIERGCELDARDLGGATALMLAAQRGHTPIVAQLLHAGADAGARSYSNESALGQAVVGGHTAAVRALLAAPQAGVATKMLDGLSHEQLVMLVRQLVTALQVGGGARFGVGRCLGAMAAAAAMQMGMCSSVPHAQWKPVLPLPLARCRSRGLTDSLLCVPRRSWRGTRHRQPQE